MTSSDQNWTHVRDTRAVTIQRPFAVVAGYLSNPLTYSAWATKYFTGPVVEVDQDTYRVPTVAGERRLRVVMDVERGIFDIYLAPLDQAFSYALPVRVLANGDGADVLFTLTREPELTDSEWDESLLALEHELHEIKRQLES